MLGHCKHDRSGAYSDLIVVESGAYPGGFGGLEAGAFETTGSSFSLMLSSAAVANFDLIFSTPAPSHFPKSPLPDTERLSNPGKKLFSVSNLSPTFVLISPVIT